MDTSISQTGVKQKFKLEGNGIVRTNWEDDEGQTEIYSKREWKKMIEWAYKILVLEGNRSLSRYLMAAVPKIKGIVSRLET